MNRNVMKNKIFGIVKGRVLAWLLALVLGGTVIWCCWMAFWAVCLIAQEHGAKIDFKEISEAMDRLVRRRIK